ncbi:hypothetical protein D3C85_1442900 [compost metagenome]
MLQLSQLTEFRGHHPCECHFGGAQIQPGEMTQSADLRRQSAYQVPIDIGKTKVGTGQIQGAQVGKRFEKIVHGFTLEQMKVAHRQPGHFA